MFNIEKFFKKRYYMFIEILPRLWITNLTGSVQDKYIDFYKITNIIDCYKDIKTNKDVDNYLIELVKLIQMKISKYESIVLISKKKQELYVIILLYCMIFGKIPLANIYNILKYKVGDFEITKHKSLLKLVNSKI